MRPYIGPVGESVGFGAWGWGIKRLVRALGLEGARLMLRGRIVDCGGGGRCVGEGEEATEPLACGTFDVSGSTARGV